MFFDSKQTFLHCVNDYEHFTANCKNVVRFDKKKTVFLSSLLLSQTKQKQYLLFNCLKRFLLNDIIF
jgi:hypothetical protein